MWQERTWICCTCRWSARTSTTIRTKIEPELGIALKTDPARLAVLASLQVPGATLVGSLDLAIALSRTSVVVVSGFQSPVERECLKFLLTGTAKMVVCPARSSAGMRIPSAWRPAINADRLSIRSAVDEGFEESGRTSSRTIAPRRATAALAEQRNRFLVSISDAVLFLHASPRGKLDRLATDLLANRKPLWTLEDPANQHLIERGARPVTPATIESIWAEA